MQQESKGRMSAEVRWWEGGHPEKGHWTHEAGPYKPGSFLAPQQEGLLQTIPNVTANLGNAESNAPMTLRGKCCSSARLLPVTF